MISISASRVNATKLITADANSFSSTSFSSLLKSAPAFITSFAKPLTNSSVKVSQPAPEQLSVIAGNVMTCGMRSISGGLGFLGGVASLAMLMQGANAKETIINTGADLEQFAGKFVPALDTLVIKNDINATDFSRSIARLDGAIQGNKHRIFGLKVPLVKNVKKTGIIQNLAIDGANIQTHDQTVGVLACDANGRLENIHVRNSKIKANNKNAIAGGVVAVLMPTVPSFNLRVENSTIESACYAGGVIGFL